MATVTSLELLNVFMKFGIYICVYTVEEKVNKIQAIFKHYQFTAPIRLSDWGGMTIDGKHEYYTY